MREDRVYSILSADSTVTAQVSNRIYPDVAPQGTAAPFIVYSLVSGTPDLLIAGGAGFDRLRVQVDCYSITKSGAIALGAIVRASIEAHGYLISMNPAPREPDSNLYRDSADYELIEFS